MPAGRLANGKFLTAISLSAEEDLGDEGVITVLGRYVPEHIECNEPRNAR